MAKSINVSRWVADLTREVSSWPGVSTYLARFGGTAFRFGTAEIGHIHLAGSVHILFPRPVRDELLAQGAASDHPWAPNTGNASFVMRAPEDLVHALWLMRISYLPYELKESESPETVLAQESERLDLDPTLKMLLEPFAQRSRATAPPPALSSPGKGKEHQQ
jgi:hypothetical protein